MAETILEYHPLSSMEIEVLPCLQTSGTGSEGRDCTSGHALPYGSRACERASTDEMNKEPLSFVSTVHDTVDITRVC